MDPVKNFAKIVVSTGYGSSAVSITLQDGDGAKLPTPATDGEFNLVWWNFTDYPDPSDDAGVEIVRCTAKTGDVITVVRAQEGMLASDKNLFNKKYKMILALTKKMMDDISIELISKLVNIVEDLTPQLGGNLDLQTHKIVGEGGTEGIYIDSAGKVGIGTSSPTQALEITQDQADGINMLIRSNTIGANRDSLLAFSVSTNPDSIYAAIGQSRDVSGFGRFLIKTGTGGLLEERLTIDRNGNVGIGNITPIAKLHIIGDSQYVAQGSNYNVIDTFQLRHTPVYNTSGAIVCTSEIAFLKTSITDESHDGEIGFSTRETGSVLTEAVRIDKEGNVGIGLTSPTSQLHIQDNYDGATTSVVENTNAGVSAIAGIRTKSELAQLLICSHSNSRTITRYGVTIGGWNEFYSVHGNGLIIGQLDSNPIIFGTNSFERMRVAADGNVGIGTTSPTQALEITQDQADGINMLIRSSTTSANRDSLLAFSVSTNPDSIYAAIGQSRDVSGFGRFVIKTGTGGLLEERLTIDRNGDVGIGTDSPSARLDIYNGSVNIFGTGSAGNIELSNANNDLIIDSSGSLGAKFRLLPWAGDNYFDNILATGNVRFRTGVIDRLWISGSNNNGNVGIGTTSPTEKFDVDSDAIRLRTAKTPASAGASGNTGDICWDADYIYTCVATNTWKRAALSTW